VDFVIFKTTKLSVNNVRELFEGIAGKIKGVDHLNLEKWFCC